MVVMIHKYGVVYFLQYLVTFFFMAIYTLVIFIPSWIFGALGAVVSALSRSKARRLQKKIKATGGHWLPMLFEQIFALFVVLGFLLTGVIRFINLPVDKVCDKYFVSGVTFKLSDNEDYNPKWFSFYCVTMSVIFEAHEDAHRFLSRGRRR